MWKMMAELEFCWDLSEVNLGEEELTLKSRYRDIQLYLALSAVSRWNSKEKAGRDWHRQGVLYKTECTDIHHTQLQKLQV